MQRAAEATHLDVLPSSIGTVGVTGCAGRRRGAATPERSDSRKRRGPTLGTVERGPPGVGRAVVPGRSRSPTARGRARRWRRSSFGSCLRRAGEGPLNEWLVDATSCRPDASYLRGRWPVRPSRPVHAETLRQRANLTVARHDAGLDVLVRVLGPRFPSRAGRWSFCQAGCRYGEMCSSSFSLRESDMEPLR